MSEINTTESMKSSAPSCFVMFRVGGESAQHWQQRVPLATQASELRSTLSQRLGVHTRALTLQYRGADMLDPQSFGMFSVRHRQCCRFSRNMAKVTPENIYFYN